MTHWKTYNKQLVKRGEILVSKDLFEDKPKEAKRKPGRPKVYPDTFIIFALIINYLMRLTYRELQGFLTSFFNNMNVKVPNFRTFRYQMALPIVEDVERKARERGKKLEKVLADKGYDTHEIFNRLKEKGICAGIIPRKGSKVRGDSARDDAVRKTRCLGINKYKQEIGYGKEYVESRKWETIKAEIVLKLFIVSSFMRGDYGSLYCLRK